MFFKRVTHLKAPEFPLRMEWIGSKRVPLKSLKGRVVLLYFWTFSSGNCLRTLPQIKAWEELYKDEPLTIIGIHTGEFEFERDRKAVEAAMKREGIKHPTILDSKYKLWNSYANRWWPRQYIIDHQGYIAYDHVGEGGYARTETALQKALLDAGSQELPYIDLSSGVAGGTIYRISNEQYLGYLRGVFGNHERLLPGEEQAFELPAELKIDTPYLKGHWVSEKEAIVHDRALSGMKDEILIRYKAFNVDVVMERKGRKIPEVEVTLDGRPIPADLQGKDLIEKDGKTICRVGETRLHNLINGAIYHGGTLSLATGSSGVAFYTISFS